MRSLYIAGRMHCGSTFLNVLLGAAPTAFPIGELVNGLKRGPQEICACGEPLESCPVWSKIAADYAATTGRDFFEDGKWLYDQADIKKFPTAYRAGNAEPWATYYQRQNDVLAAIGRVSGADIGIDSSKEFTRALLTLRADPKARVIHLIRKPVPIVGSYYWRQTKGSKFYFMKRSYDLAKLRFPALMLVAGSWNAGVIAGWFLERAAPGRVLHVSYEAFCTDPDAELARMGDFAGLDLSDVRAKVAAGSALPLQHALGGNDEIKTGDGTFTFVPNAGGRRAMPALYRWGASVFSAPGRLFQAVALKTTG